MSTSRYVRFFEEFGIDDVPLVGGKNASLGEMFQKLSGQGVRVPHGFAITAQAYRYMLDEAGAWDRLHAELDELDTADVAALERKGKRAREIVYGAGLPDDLAAEILNAYRRLQQEYGEEVSLAVRSSATAEDLPTASFAGQQDSYLNIKGAESLLDTCRRCFAGPDERDSDAPVRAPNRRSGPRAADDGRPRSAARPERAQGVRDVRDPEQRHPHR